MFDPEMKRMGQAGVTASGWLSEPATAGWANPTLTLVALAIRLAERLAR